MITFKMLEEMCLTLSPYLWYSTSVLKLVIKPGMHLENGLNQSIKISGGARSPHAC